IVKRYLIGKNYGVAVVAEGVIEKIAEEDFHELGNVQLDEHGHIRYAELDFGEILKQKVLAELKRIGIKISIVDKEIGYELRCTAPIAYDIDYARNLGYEAMQFLMRGESGALITIQDNKAVPLRFEDIRDPETGKTYVRKVNINSVHYRIARGFMTRLEKGDLDDAGVANAFRMSPEEFKNRYLYLFDDEPSLDNAKD
ncbi:MAG: 6-phosphofructokinase, partial [Selenomonadaceae bacterium]|nr:6-phosphofructokinase [Selenomonadaceae bacterium]